MKQNIDPRQVERDAAQSRVEQYTKDEIFRHGRVEETIPQKVKAIQDKAETEKSLERLAAERKIALRDGVDTSEIEKKIKAGQKEIAVLEKQIAEFDEIIQMNDDELVRIDRFKATALKQAQIFDFLVKYQDWINTKARADAERLREIAPEFAAAGLDPTALFPVRFLVINTPVEQVLGNPSQPIRYEFLK